LISDIKEITETKWKVRCVCEDDNINMDVKEVEGRGLNSFVCGYSERESEISGGVKSRECFDYLSSW
jgi:hypothetical protein